MRFSVPILSLALAAMVLSGCQETGDSYGANVYTARDVNQQQDAEMIQILSIMPAKVELDNSKAKHNAELLGGVLGAIGGGIAGNKLTRNSGSGTALGVAGGGLLGAATGSLVSDKVLVDGISITYAREGKTQNAVQVGRSCNFIPGPAVMLSGNASEARIQPNAQCAAP